MDCDGTLADDRLIVARRVLRHLVVRAFTVIRGNRHDLIDLALAKAPGTTHGDLSIEKVDRLVTDELLLADAARRIYTGPITRQPIILLFSASTGTIQRMI